MKKTVLVLGASGRVGRHGVCAFTKAQWNVRIFDRRKDDLDAMAEGADVILNGWNPPYTEWARVVPELTARVIKAAQHSGATVIQPGNVYNFGGNEPEVFNETTPQCAKNPLGRVRIAMESAYRRAAVRLIVLRAGDFIDTTQSGGWYDMILTSKLSKGVFTYPGDPDIPHAWAYLPDLLKSAVELAEIRRDLNPFEDIPFPGFTLSGHQMAEETALVTGAPVRLKHMSTLPLRLASPFWPMGRCLVEMSYLWRKSHQLDGKKFTRLLPNVKLTPVQVALAAALSLDINPDQTVMRADAPV